MKRIFKVLFVCAICSLFSTNVIKAQEAFRAFYEMRGTYSNENPTENKPFPIALEIYPDRTFCYHVQRMTSDSIVAAVMEQSNDPVLAQNESNKVNVWGMRLNILSDFNKQQREVTHALNFDHYAYNEEMIRPDWKIDETVTEEKSGYKCHKATTTYFGRAWTVWYTPDIPTPAGPWKLWGLPGLIVEGSESDGIYGFSLSSFESFDPKESKVDCEKYLALGKKKVETKKKVTQLLELYVTDTMAFFQMIFPGTQVTVVNESGNKLSREELMGKFVNIEK